MKRKYYRTRSRAASWSARFGWCGLLLLVAGVVLHRSGWLSTADVFRFGVLPAVLAVMAAALAVKGFTALLMHGYKGGVASFKGGVLAVLTLAPFVFAAVSWFMFPPLHDVATDLETPPAFLPGLRPENALPLAGNLTAQTQEQFKAWPQLSSRRYDGSPDTIFKAVLSVMKAKGLAVTGSQGVIGEDSELYVQAVAKTPVMGFVSDTVVRLADEGDTTFVDIRAASRYLQRDFGINARLAVQIMDALDAEVLLTPGDKSQD